MAIIKNTYTGNGTTVLFSFTFPYLNESDVKVAINGNDITTYTLENATTVRCNTAPANGATVLIYRSTADEDPAATFYSGSSIRASDLNNNQLQILYLAQETKDITVEASSGTVADGSVTGVKLATGAVTQSKVDPALLYAVPG